VAKYRAATRDLRDMGSGILVPDITYDPYYPGGWDDDPATDTPIIAAALDQIDTGITAATGQANTALSTAGAAQAAASAETTRAETAEALKAPLASPAFTGTPTAPTQATGDTSTKLATDAFVAVAVAAETARADEAEAAKLPLAGGTMSGWLAPAVVALTFGTSIAVNAELGNAFDLTLTASTGTVAAPANPVDGQVIRFRITQGAGGGFTVVWNAVYDFGAAGAPTLSTAAGKVDILAFEYVASISKWAALGSGLGY
jgi:hypothetical protein